MLRSFSFEILQSHRRPQRENCKQAGALQQYHRRPQVDCLLLAQLSCRQIGFCVSQKSSTAVPAASIPTSTLLKVQISHSRQKKVGTYGEQRGRETIYQTGVSHSFLRRRMDGLLAHMFSLPAQPVVQPQFHTQVIYLCIFKWFVIPSRELQSCLLHIDFFLKGKKSNLESQGPAHVPVGFGDKATMS